MRTLFAFTLLVLMGSGWHLNGIRLRNIVRPSYPMLSHPLSSITSIPIHQQRKSSLHATLPRSSTTHVKPRNSIEYQLRGCILRNDWDEAATIVSSLKTTKVSSRRDVLYILTETCRKTKNIDQLLPLLQQLPEDLEFTSREDDIMPLLAECAEKNTMRSIQPMLLYLKEHYHLQFTAKAYATMIKGYGRQGNEAMIDRVLAQCHHEEISIDIIFINCIMDAYIRCGNLDKAYIIFLSITSKEESFNDMQQLLRSSKSNKVIFTRNADILKILLFFRDSGNHPNVRTCNTLMKGFRDYDDGNSIQRSISLLNEMQSLNIQPDTISMNTLVDTCIIAKDFQHVEKLLMEGSLQRLGVEGYTSIINGYSQIGDVQGAFRIFNLMKDNNIIPNSYTMTSLMNAALNGKMFSLALNLLHNTESKYFINLQQNERIALYGTYIIKMCKISTFIGTMVRTGEMNLINGSIKQYQYLQEALITLLSMELKGLLPDVATLNSFIQCICSLEYFENKELYIKSSLELLKIMISMNITPDDYTYGVLFDELGKEGMIEQALDLYSSLIKNGYTLHTNALNNLLKVLINSSEPIYTIGLFYELIRNDESIGLMEQFIPDKISFTLIFITLAKIIKLSTYEGVPNSMSNSKRHFINKKMLPKRYFLLPKNKKLSPLLKVYQELEILSFESNTETSTNNQQQTNISTSTSTSTLEDEEEFLRSSTILRYNEEDGRLYETTMNIKSSSKKESNNNTSLQFHEIKKMKNKSSKYENKVLLKLLSNQSKKQMTKKVEELLRELYQLLRYHYRIEPDETLCKVLDSLFAIKPQSSIIYSLGRNSFTGFSKETARFIFEDLIMAGISPSQLLNILSCCEYSKKIEQGFLEEGELLRKFRANAASFRIFKRHGWNTVESGWSPFF